jgi:voltage-gated potassium channel
MSSPASSGPVPEQVGPFQLTVLVLSLLALAAIAADTFLPLPHEVSRLLHGVDLVVCAVFFLDFVLRFRATESKLAFMRWGWIDLVASIPSFDLFRLGRFVRVLRVLRLLRGIPSLRRLFGIMFASRRSGGVVTVALTMFLLVVFASIGMLLCETAEKANIKTAEDAVWWSVTTVTTVGYGDHFPVTLSGRAIAMVLMIAGVGMFGALSGIIASIFLGRRDEEDTATLAEVRALRADLNRIRERDGEPLV